MTQEKFSVEMTIREAQSKTKNSTMLNERKKIVSMIFS